MVLQGIKFQNNRYQLLIEHVLLSTLAFELVNQSKW